MMVSTVFKKDPLGCQALGAEASLNTCGKCTKNSECQFVVYGTVCNCDVCARNLANVYANIEYRRVFGYMSDFDLNDFLIILNILEWDGLPTILINMKVADLPLFNS